MANSPRGVEILRMKAYSPGDRHRRIAHLARDGKRYRAISGGNYALIFHRHLERKCLEQLDGSRGRTNLFVPESTKILERSPDRHPGYVITDFKYLRIQKRPGKIILLPLMESSDYVDSEWI